MNRKSVKETAASIAASAKAGMEKTKATVQEKAEKMTTRDPLQKEMATQKKDERIHEAEREKHEATGGGAFGHNYTTAPPLPYTAEGGVHPQTSTRTPTDSATGVAGRVGHQDPNTY
ncbi:hypothetical protein ACP275_11G003700 [Erythranthe tilingii]